MILNRRKFLGLSAKVAIVSAAAPMFLFPTTDPIDRDLLAWLKSPKKLFRGYHPTELGYQPVVRFAPGAHRVMLDHTLVERPYVEVPAGIDVPPSSDGFVVDTYEYHRSLPQVQIEQVMAPSLRAT